MKKSKLKNVSDRNRTGRLFIDQEDDMSILEAHGFDFQKLFREGMALVIQEKMKLIGASSQAPANK